MHATKEQRASKSNILFVNFPQTITLYRALIYAYMCG